jgi:hypothetical protein
VIFVHVPSIGHGVNTKFTVSTRWLQTANNLRQIYGAERLVPGCLGIHMLVSYETEVGQCEREILVWSGPSWTTCWSVPSVRRDFWLPHLSRSVHISLVTRCSSAVHEAWSRDKPPPRYLPGGRVDNYPLPTLAWQGRPAKDSQPCRLMITPGLCFQETLGPVLDIVGIQCSCSLISNMVFPTPHTLHNTKW